MNVTSEKPSLTSSSALIDPPFGRDEAADSSARILPRIRREGIRWHGGIGANPLTLELTFENPAPVASEVTQARIEIADFGAFLPWRPLTSVVVPPIPPRGRIVVTATPEEEERPSERPAGLSAATTGLAAQLSGLQAEHFVGNINVYVDRSAPVERHCAQAIGLQAGQSNCSLFIVGDGTPDTYTYRSEAESGWDVRVDSALAQMMPELGVGLVFVHIIPPADAQAGRVTIWVRRESTGQDVPVEFELMACAPEASCYRV